MTGSQVTCHLEKQSFQDSSELKPDKALTKKRKKENRRGVGNSIFVV